MSTRHFRSIFIFTLVSLFIISLAACSTSSVMDMSFLSYTVKAVDENNQPIPNAVVESDDGQQVTTEEDGTAKLRFSAIGGHRITVSAPDHEPYAFDISMPMDAGKDTVAKLKNIVPATANIETNANVNAKPNVNINIGANYSAMMMSRMYPMLFQAMFSAYGYSMDLQNYKEGQWTEWEFRTNDGNPMYLRKAYLKQLPNKQEWWGMYMKNEDKKNSMLMEVLFSPNRDSIRRMRQKMGDGDVSEVPVSENMYTQPTKLTPESLEGSVKQHGVMIKVPAGRFKADLLEFGAMGTGGKLRMWRVKSIPGGVVRVEVTDDSNNVVWSSVLSGQGNGAKTQLNSY